MKRLVTYFSKLFSPFVDLQSSDVSTTLALTVGSPSAHRRGAMLKLMSVLALVFSIGVGNAWGATIASWGKVSIAANTNVTASGGDANNSGTAKFQSSKAMTSAGGSSSKCYYGSSAGGAVINFTSLNLSTYTSIQMTFYARASQSGNLTLEASADGTNWVTIGSTAVSTSEGQKTISGIPFFATYLRLTHDKSSGSLYFGTAVISGTSAATKTITWSVNGSNTTAGSPTSSVPAGEKVWKFPTDPTSSDCDGSKVFVGWTGTPIVGTTDTKPSDLFTDWATAPSVTVNTTYYAVFASQTDFTRVTSTGDLADGQLIVVVDNQNSKVLTTAPGYTTAPTETSSKITPSVNMIWTLEANSTNWKLKTGTLYLGASATDNGTAVSLTSTNSTWTIGASSSGTNHFYLKNTNGTNLCLEYYSSGTKWTVYANAGYSSSTYFTERLYVATRSAYATSCASCGSDPTVTAASNNGSITSTSIPVQCASGISNIGGAGCSLSSYGFVWAPSATTTSPTLSNSSHEVGTSIAASTGFNYTITGLNPNTSYSIRPYATNGHGTAYGTVYTVTTLQRYTISYNNNGGSGSMASSTKDHGVAFALPANAGTMTKTGYHIKQWRLNAADGTAYALSGSYEGNANATFYVDWEANTYTVTLNGNGATGAGSPSTVTATYNSNTLSSAITNPTKTDYIFGGWNTKDDGTGLTVIDASGNLVASQSGYTDASKNWIKDGGVTLYAKWTEHTYTNYRTQCCTKLGEIDGETTLTQGGNSVTISGWSDVSNASSYTVKLYKYNTSTSDWDLVSGSTSGGSAGAQGTRTGIATDSKSVTYTGLEVESEYKFSVTAIGNGSSYCDGDETDVNEINDIDVSSTPFKFRYSIYIDNGSNSGWAHHYITPTGNTDEGSIDITLAGPVDYYQFKIGGGFSGWWGQTGESKYTTGGTQWTLDGSQNVKMQTWIGGTYTFTVDYSGTTNPKVTITYPSANQDAGNIVYWDASVVANWDHLHFRVGTDGNANAGSDCKTDLQKVPGTDNFYKVTTASFTGMRVWAIANNTGWTGSNTNGVYKTNTGDGYAVTLSSEYQDYVVGEDGVTLVPYGSGTMGSYSHDNNCRFYTVTKTDGMLTHNVSLNSPAHGTLLVTYTNTSGTTGQTVTEGNNADLAHRCILTITATPDDGYTCSSLTVNSADFTSGNTHILSDDATIEATFTAQTSTVTLDNNDATSGTQQTVTATYDAAMPLTTTADGTPAVAALTRTGYTFNGWWDNTSGGNQYYTYSGSPKVIASARTWDKTGAQTLKAQWIVNQYTLTWDLQGGTVATAGTGAAAAATGTPSSDQDYGTALTAPVVTKTGYTFSAWSPSVAATMPAENTTYTASWTANVYNITYKDQGDNAYSGNATAGVPTGAPTTHTYGSATALVNGVKDGYRFDGWFTDASCTVSAGSSIGATAKTADFTLYAKWTQVYTVTWSVNGDTWESGVVEGNTHVPGGSKVSALPTAPTSSDCDDSKVFVGWKAAEIDGVSVSDPGGIFTTQAGSPTIDANKTFYAVFADRSGGDYTRVTSTSQLVANKKIVMGYEADYASNQGVIVPVQSQALNGTLLYTGTTEGSAGTGTVNMSTLTYEDGANYQFTLKAGYNSGYWAFEMSGENTGKYIGHNGKNSVTSYTGVQTDGKTDFSIELGTNDVATITNKYGNENTTQDGKNYYNYKILSYNYNTGNPRTAIYRAAQTGEHVLYIANPYVYSNYVTSCASCDADATYTNTTPTVSEIECTDATLTMPGGLATLGAAGCNISDYGFVIGTSDNPAIGGSGVTKLQVGTTNPTTGEDFSYDATDLTKGTHYYIRAYAINRHGTAYSTNSQNFWTKDVSSIAITTAPTKTNYIVGETFDATGMVVTATMASGSTENVTSDVTYSTDALTAGTNKDFAIEYTLCETDKSVNQKINVYTLSVSEGTNPSYGSYSVEGAVITVTPNAQKTFTMVPTNAEIRDNGNGTYTVINPTGNVTVVINYRDAVQVKVYYRVDGVEVTGLTQDVYESSQTTLPTASALASAMAAQSMELPDELYPNFLGWSETEFGAQTADPTLVTGTPTINASKSFYAVYSNVNKIRIDESVITGTSYPGSEQTVTVSSKDFKYYTVIKSSANLQFKKASNTSYIYNNTAISNIVKIEVGANDGSSYSDAVPVYAGSDANTISGSALVDEDTYRDRYVYLFPSNTQYFIVKGNNSYVYQVDYIDVYYSSSTDYYMTQFCTRYDITGASTSGTAVIVNGNTGGTLTSSHNALCEGKSLTLSATVNTQYSFGEWKIVKTGSDPEVDLTNTLLGANKTSMTPPAFAMPGYGITVSATISEKTATAWSWTYNSAAIPDPMILYVGEVKQLDVTYTPDAAQLVAAQKNYSVEKESSVAQVSKTANYYRMRGAAGVTVETNTAVTFSLNSLSQVVNVTVKPLPSARFEDNVHNAVSTTVTATVTDGVVSLTKKTPTHADVAAPVGGNECETTHLHLVGWIDGDWEPFINYMNGGSRPSDSDITSATGYFYLPNADIDLSVKGGKTYYAVWGKADE